MESNSEASCISDPNFAIICAFLERFAASCGITYPSFVDLQEMLENTEEVHQELIELHIMLLRKARRSVFREKWEKALVKFCHSYSTQDGWEIERFGYKNSRLEVKLRVLKTLLEGQFDSNLKFKSTINSLESTELRSKPVGKDKTGRIYWLQFDPISNIRVYREDLDEESWTLVAKDRDTLVQLLQELSEGDDSIDVSILIEDSSASPETEKPILDTGQADSISENVTNVELLDSKAEMDIEVANIQTCVKYDTEMEVKDETDVKIEKDPLEIKESDVNISEMKIDESQSDSVVDAAETERKNFEAEQEAIKQLRLDDPEENMEVSEAVEEPVMHVYGDGNGADCNAGNPDKEEGKADEASSANASEQPDAVNSELKMAEVEIRPQPKLWSIDTICGTSSVNHMTEGNKSVKSNQKNFSSFSIESVLEKKMEVVQSSSLSESPLISVNTISMNNVQVGPILQNINQIGDQVCSVSNESPVCSVDCEKNSLVQGQNIENEEVMTSNLNEVNPVPIFQKNKIDEDSTVCADISSHNFAMGEKEIRTQTSNEPIILKDDQVKILENTKDNQLETGNGNFESKIKHESEITTSQELQKIPEIHNSDLEQTQKAGPELMEFEKSYGDVESIHANNSKSELVAECPLTRNEDPENDKRNVLNVDVKNEPVTSENIPAEEHISKESFDQENDDNIAKQEPVEETKIGTNESSKEMTSVEKDEKEVKTDEVDAGMVAANDEGNVDNVEEKTCEAVIARQDEKDSEPTESAQEREEISADVTQESESIKVSEDLPEMNDQKVLEPTIPEEPNNEVSPNIRCQEPEESIKNEKQVAVDLSKTEEPNESSTAPDKKACDLPPQKNSEGDTGNFPEAIKMEVEDHNEIAHSVSDEVEPPSEKEQATEISKMEEDELETASGETDLTLSKEISETAEDGNEMECKRLERIEEEEESKSNHVTVDVKHESDAATDATEEIVKDVGEPSEPMKASEVTKDEETDAYENEVANEVSKEAQGESYEESDAVPKDEVEGHGRTKRKKIEGRRKSQNLAENAEDIDGDQTRTRTTRSRKKSLEEDTQKKTAAPKRDSRGGKRKSQDSNEPPEGVDETSDTAEAASKKLPKRRSSTVNSTSEDNCNATQEEVDDTDGKGTKKKNKKAGVRKSLDEKTDQEETCNDDANNADEQASAGEDKKKDVQKKSKDGTPRSRRTIPNREIKLLGLSNTEELPTVRQSRRIALLKLKEEAERNRIKKESDAAKEGEKKDKKKKKKKAAKLGIKKRKKSMKVESEYEEDEEDEEGKGKKEKEKGKKKRKKKDKLVFNELNPWISSSGSSSADEEEEEIEDEAHEEEELLFKSDHEFSPESDIEDPDYKPIKRARTAKVDPKDATEADSKYDDTACEKCSKKDHPEWILLCDNCDKGWHASCVRPALMVVPEGDWFCPPCEHTSLIQKLRESLVEYDRCQKQRENEILRKKRLAFVGISLDNVLPSKKDKKRKPSDDNEGESDETASENGSDEESSSSGSSDSESASSAESSEPVYQLRERRSNITSYRYNEYDELIKSALQEEMEAVKVVANPNSLVPEAGDRDEEEEIADVAAVESNVPAIDAHAPQALNPQIPRDILEAKPRLKPKKDEDGDYEVETDADEDEDGNGEDDEDENEEEDEDLADEVPPVVPQYDKKKKKSRSLNVKSLDFTSDEEEEDNSDSDFKGESSEEESEFSLPSESESSDGVRRKKKSFDGPLRRSTRARTARYDREFINDESEDEEPRRKKSRNVWVESESSDSDRSWGKRKKKVGRSGNRTSVLKRKAKTKTKKKKNRRRIVDSDNEDDEKTPKKPRNRKIKYGGLSELGDEQVLTRRTRGKKINYQEMNASDSEEEVVKKRARVIGDSDEEFVAEKEKSDGSDEEAPTKVNANSEGVNKASVMRFIKKKRKSIAEGSEFGKEPEEKELRPFVQDLNDLNAEEEVILEKMLGDGDVPIYTLKDALKKLMDRRRGQMELSKPYPPIPEHLENPGLGPRFPKIGKMKVTPNRVELAQIGIHMEPVVQGIRPNPGLMVGNPPKDVPVPESVPVDQQGLLMMNEQKKDELMCGLQPPPYPYPADTPTGVVPPLLNPHPNPFPLNSRPPMAPFNSFQGMIPQHTRMPPEYPNIPTTVLGIENDSLQERRLPKQSAKSNLKTEEGHSPQADSGEENSGDGRMPDNADSPPKRRGRGRGKKQLLAEAQAKQDLGMSTVQAPTQFPPPGLPPEGGSVITRILNTPHGPQQFPDFQMPARGRPPFRPPFPNAIRPPMNPPSPRLRGPGPGLFHASHALDPSSAPVNLPPPGKPVPFPPRPAGIPRFPSDPNLRPQFASQSPPPRSEAFPYPNFFGPYPPIPNSDEAQYHSPNFPAHPFDEQHQQPPVEGGNTGSKPTYEEEAGGEFGGLASYFASQREDDLDT